MADKDIDPVSGNHISPYMQDITGMFMLLAGKTDWMFRVSLIAELVPLVKKCYINPSRVLSVCHAIAVMLPAEWGEIQKPDKYGIVFDFTKSDQSRSAPFSCCRDDFCQLLLFMVKPSGRPVAVAGGEEIIVRRKRIVFRVEQVLDVVAHHAEVCLPL